MGLASRRKRRRREHIAQLERELGIGVPEVPEWEPERRSVYRWSRDPGGGHVLEGARLHSLPFASAYNSLQVTNDWLALGAGVRAVNGAREVERRVFFGA